MTWTLPLRLGARDDTLDIEHGALLDALRRYFDTSEGTELWDETRAEARAIEMIWRIGWRVGKQNFPLKMLENLPKWEEACRLKPAIGTPDVERRAALAGKLRGLGGNDVASMIASAALVAGKNFTSGNLIDPSDVVSYWPGINPGPPGYEFSSSFATLGIQLNKNGLSEAEFLALRNKVIENIDDLRPSWMTYVIGTDDTFLFGIGIVNQSVVA